jgi:hypothetical protein
LEDEAKPLACQTHCRGVDQRLDFVDVVAHDAEEQRLIAIMQRVQRHIFFKGIGQTAQIDQHTLGLSFDRKHARRQEAPQPQRVAFRLGEGGTLVKQGIAQ